MTDHVIVCVGGAFWDTVFLVDEIPARPGKILPRRAVQVGAGMAPAAAVTIARFGGRAALWSRVGRDAAGDDFCCDMTREGVDIRGVRRLAGSTSYASILVDRGGERLVVPFVDPSLDPDPGWLDLASIADAAAVFADCRWLEGAMAAFSKARAVGVPTILDADVAPSVVLEALVPLADHLLFSEAALAQFSGDRAPEEALAAVGRRFAPVVAGVTLGAEGALVWTSASAAVAAVPTIRVEAVDTLSAGDTWHGAYAYGLVQGWDVAETILTANVAAAMKCERFGGRLGTPTLEAVKNRMTALGHGKKIVVHNPR